MTSRYYIQDHYLPASVSVWDVRLIGKHDTPEAAWSAYKPPTDNPAWRVEPKVVTIPRDATFDMGYIIIGRTVN